MRVWRSVARPRNGYSDIDAADGFWSAPQGNIVIMEEDAFYKLMEALSGPIPCRNCDILLEHEELEHDKMLDKNGYARCDYCANRGHGLKRRLA